MGFAEQQVIFAWFPFAYWYLTQTRKRVIIARNDGIYSGNWHPAFGADED
jgi:hypothetical protein